ncbi:MAG TPA: YCF48-related protein [Candidatus Binatia bacterium]|nr:YCF48-related protein [Candidatus Binatia bacterium]
MCFVFFCLAGLILGLAPQVLSSDAVTLAKEPALQENFYGVQIRDRQVWVVGYYGTILHSKDRGLTWEIQQSPARNALFRVRFTSLDKGWISGSYGTLLHTTNGGKHWSTQATKTTEQLFGLSFANEQMGWVVGSRGTVLHTRDAGLSWNNASIPEDITFSDVAFVNASRGWIVGEFGVIFHTSNGGKSWSKQKSPVEVSFASGESRNLFALLFTEAEEGWAFGLDGVILNTRDGSRWETVRQKEKTNNSPDANHLFAAAAFKGRLWTVGERGTFLESNSEGKSWQPVKAEIPRVSLNGIAFGKDGLGFIVGNRGVMLRTEDGGATWRRLKVALRGAEQAGPP